MRRNRPDRVLVRALDDSDARVRVAAAKELLDRGHGKPATVADVTLRQESADLAQSHLQALLELVAKRPEPQDITRKTSKLVDVIGNAVLLVPSA